jgi:dephospho-CoA kinase
MDDTVSHFVVGVSGGIGSGKSTVTDLFMEYGIDVIDADEIAKQVVEPGKPAFIRIVDKFGESILDTSGNLDRAKLRSIVFQDEPSKNWLNQLLHPAIRQQMLLQTQQSQSAYCLLSVPLLVENKLYEQVDSVLIVDVNEESQLQRAVKRDQSNEQQIRAIMRAQVTREQRLTVADHVIDNNGTPDLLAAQVAKLHHLYLQLSHNKPQG